MKRIKVIVIDLLINYKEVIKLIMLWLKNWLKVMF